MFRRAAVAVRDWIVALHAVVRRAGSLTVRIHVARTGTWLALWRRMQRTGMAGASTGWLLVAYAVVVMTGCADPGPPAKECEGGQYVPYVRPVSLAKLPDLKPIVSYDVTFEENAQSTSTLKAAFHYGSSSYRDAVDSFTDDDIRYCPQLDPSFTARVGSFEVPGASSGGWGCYAGAGATCFEPTVSLPDPLIEPDAELMLADRSRSITIPVGELSGERRVTPIENPDWSFRVGQAITLQWSPASDLAAGVYPRVDFRCADCPGDRASFGISDFTLGLDTLGFTLPDFAGTGTMTVSLGHDAVDHGGYSLSVHRAVTHHAVISR
jgi:hypothetical protein